MLTSNVYRVLINLLSKILFDGKTLIYGDKNGDRHSEYMDYIYVGKLFEDF